MSRDWHELVSQPNYEVKLEEDFCIEARDGTHLFADVYRPNTQGKFPALLSISPYGKDIQKLHSPIGPSDYVRGNGGMEAGISEYFVTRGYVHVIADYRGIGQSEGEYCHFGQKEQEDGYDIIEWIAKQSWCNGNVGMLGNSYFAVNQYLVAAQNPPHLKAIFAHDGFTDMYRHLAYHGGILNFGFYNHIWKYILTHSTKPISKKEFSASQFEEMLKELRNNEDFKGYPFLYMVTITPEKNPLLLDLLLHPYDGPFYWERSTYTKFDKIKIPCFLLSRWSAWSIHLPGAFDAFLGIKAQKKLMVVSTMVLNKKGVRGFDRPWHENHDIILRWYDHWLKGIDTGIMDEPPIKLFIQGINQWRYENEWPLERTKWSKFYLREEGALAEVPPIPNERPDSFINVPWLKSEEKIPGAQYTTAPFNQDIEITGPISLYFYASLNEKDANWIVEIKDIYPDGSGNTISRGWLRASHRELDSGKSKPYKPYNPHTASHPIIQGEIYEYVVEMRETSNVFRAGHRIQLLIKGQDTPWEEAINRFHITNMKETRHTIYHTTEYTSYLLLPIIPS